MEEEWRDISGYEGYYKISNMGRVKSLNYGRTGKEKILRPHKTRHGYLKVDLCKSEKHKTYRVHRLVLENFSPCDNMNELQVNHIDEDKTNNNLNNLEWVTRKENCNHGTRNLRVAEKLTNGKLSIPVVQLSLDGKVINVYKSIRGAEREGGFTQPNIVACCKNKYLREGNNIYKGYRWCYLHEYISKIDSRINKVILFDKEYLVN